MYFFNPHTRESAVQLLYTSPHGEPVCQGVYDAVQVPVEPDAPAEAFPPVSAGVGEHGSESAPPRAGTSAGVSIVIGTEQPITELLIEPG